MDRQYYVKRTTKNYEYILHFELKHSRNGYTSAHLFVGDPKDPCLSLSVPLQDSLKNNRYDVSDLSIANLNKIKDMKECIVSGNGPSFAKELLTDVITVIRNNYDHIRHISLTDSSYIPCDVDDTLNLLSYSVGLYGKTWYELNYDAYFVPRDKFIEYKCNVSEYSKKETKLVWEKFIKSIYGTLNIFAKEIFDEHANIIRDMYNAADTYPLFFQALSKFVPKEHKCKFFKDWFERFIENFVVVPRNWYIDLYTVRVKPMRFGGTRKSKSRQKRDT
jgi:hypothetical protein